MPSGLDLLKPIEDTQPKSGMDLLSPPASKTTSGLDLLEQMKAPTTTAPIEVELDKKVSAPNLLYKEHTERMAEWFKESKPSEKPFEEQAVGEKVGTIAAETLSGMTDLATHPLETIRGGAEVLVNIPGFSVGLLDAGSMAIKEIVNQLSQGPAINLENIYFAAAEGMQRSMEILEPDLSPVFGERTPTSDLASQVVMAPLAGLSMAGNAVADWEGFKDYPNVRGAARFAGDISGLVTMGALLHGPSRRAEFTKGVEEVVKDSAKIVEREKAIEANPNEMIKQVQKKMLEMEKAQAELKAQEIMEGLSKDVLIREELAHQAEVIAKEKMRPVQGRAEETFVSKKGNRYRKIDDQWVDENGQVVTNSFKLKAIKKGTEKVSGGEGLAVEANKALPGQEIKFDGQFDRSALGKGPLYQFTPQAGEMKGRTIAVEELSVDAIKNKLEQISETRPKTVKKFKHLKPDPKIETKAKPKPKPESAVVEPITAVDRGTGVELPSASGESSPFFQPLEKTREFKDIYLERQKSLTENVELFTQKLINDVNQWYHKMGEVPIGQVREGLSNLAARADDLRGEFITGQDHFVWKETVQEAAVWARRLDRGVEEGKVKVKELSEAEKIDQLWETLNRGKKKEGVKKATKPKELSPRDKLDRYSAIADMANIPGGATALPTILRHKDKFSKGELEKLTEYFTTVGANRQRVETIAKELGIRDLIDFNKKEVTVGEKPKEATIYEQQVNARQEAIYKNLIGPDMKPIKVERIPRKDMEDFNYNEENMFVVRKNQKPIPENKVEIESGEKIDLRKYDVYNRSHIEANKWLEGQREKPKTILRKKGEGGTQFYDIGGATTKGAKDAAKQIAKLYKSAKAKGKEARGVKDFRPKDAVRMLKQELTRDWVDRSGNIRGMLLDKLGDEGYRALQGLYTAKGAGALAYNKLKQMDKEVYGGLPNSVKRIVDDLIFHSRIVDIAKYKTPKQFKELEKYTPEESIVFLEMFGEMEGLDPKFARKLYHVREDGSIGGRVGAYFDHMKQTLKDMLDAELITEQEFNDLAAHNYRRLKIVEVFDKKRPALGKKGVSVYDSGVESLARGRESTIFERDSRIMALEVFNRAYGRILNNQANKNLLSIARDHKDNPFVRIKEGKEDKIPSGWRRHFLYEKGERKQVYLSPEMSKEWISVNPETSYKYSQLMRYASMSPVLRTFATGINWGFAVANLPRDIMHVWYAGRVFENGAWSSIYSPHMPVFAAQMARDQSAVFLDALNRKGRYQDYINEGGGMEFLTHQGRIWQKGKHLDGPVDKIYNFLGYFGETTEIMTRLATRERVIRRRANERNISMEEARKDKDIAKEATFAARDYMDFAQGGGLSKAMDNAIPYLNATIQGTRGMFRAFQPGSGTAMSSTYKLAQFAGLVAGVTVAARSMHPETMAEMMGNVDAENNLIIPLGDKFGFEDSRGQKRYMYFKVPLDPGQKFFKTFFEASTDKWLGNEVDVDRVIGSLKEQSPVGASSLPPSFSSVIGYWANKDFWLNDEIWKKTDPLGYDRPEWAGGDAEKGSKMEFVPGRTPQAYIDIGKFTGLSPERTKHAVEEVTTSGTVYSYLMGEGYDAMFDEMPNDARQKHIGEVLSKVPIAKRFFGLTNPYSKHAEKIEVAQEEFETERFIENQKIDTLAEGYLFRDNVSRGEVFDYIGKAGDKDTADRLRERFKFQEATQNLPERSFWLRLQGVSVETRAKVFVDRLSGASPEQQEQIWKEYAIMSRAKGVISKSFRREVSRLMGEE